VPNQYVGAASLCDQFRGWSYTDLAGRVANGQIPALVIKKFLRVHYTVTPVDGDDTGHRTGTIKEFEDDTSAGKAWSRAFIPHKWFGQDFE